MKGKTSWLKMWLVAICLTAGLILASSIVYAVDEVELKGELEKTYQELQASDPEAAQEFIREYQEAVKSGEITVEKADKEATKEKGERGERGRPEGEGRYSGEREGPRAPDFDLTKPEDRTMALERLDSDSAFLKEKGLSDDDLKALKDAISRGDEDAEIFDKMDRMGLGPPEPGDFERFGPPEGMERYGPPEGMERYGPPEGMERFGPPEGMERYGPEGGREFEMNKEEMAERFREEMGREPTVQEKEMMERGDFDRPEFERPDFDRPDFDRPDFDRPDFDRPEFERPEFERPEFERPEFERPEFERPEFERPEREYEYHEPPPPPPPPEPAP